MVQEAALQPPVNLLVIDKRNPVVQRERQVDEHLSMITLCVVNCMKLNMISYSEIGLLVKDSSLLFLFFESQASFTCNGSHSIILIYIDGYIL